VNQHSRSTLVVGCIDGYTAPTDSLNFVHEIEILPVLRYEYPVIFPNSSVYWWCDVISVEPVIQTVHHWGKGLGPLEKTAVEHLNCTQPCTSFEVTKDALKPETTSTFYVRYTMGKFQQYTSRPVFISVLNCVRESASLIDLFGDKREYRYPIFSQ
jgi:hypothetical protein